MSGDLTESVEGQVLSEVRREVRRNEEWMGCHEVKYILPPPKTPPLTDLTGGWSGSFTDKL